MREGLFIKKNAAKWTDYQKNPSSNPDETAERFMTLVDDLSFAKTFYPKSKLTSWINGITAGIYQTIYQNKKEKYTRIFVFWKYELPLLFRKYHRILLFAFVLLVVFTAIGVLGQMNDAGFIRGILGDAYVDQTEENIAKGDPFGIYSSQTRFSMFVYIAAHNSFVASMKVLGGLTLGIITIWLLWQTGIMLGCFEYLFFSKGLGAKSILVIFIHGTIEISSIVIAATAGFIIANSMLFPGTYKRILSFKHGVKDALKIMVVLIPLLVVAAFFESFVTRLMGNNIKSSGAEGLPVWAGVLILIASLSFMIWYFIILPIQLNKKGFILQADGYLNIPEN